MKTAIKAANQIGKGLYGIDLKEDEQKNVYVVEINDNPNIDHGVEDLAIGEDLYDQVALWFLNQIKKKQGSVH